MAIRATVGDEVAAHRAIDAAFAEVARVHDAMSVQSPGSDLAAMATAPVGVPVVVDPRTYACLRAALTLAAESDGVFDPVLPGEGASWRDLDLVGGAVTARRRLHVDLSGIAKGQAVDRACAELRAAGASSGMVDAGGDLRVFGEEEDIVNLTPRHAAPPAAIRLADGAIASSDVAGSVAEYGTPQHRDGRDGHPIEPAFVAVAAPACIDADALTKVVLVLGDDAAPLLLARRAMAYVHRPQCGWTTIGEGR